MIRCLCQRVLQHRSLRDAVCTKNLYSSYKSKLSLDTLYPNSDQNHISHVSFKHTKSDTAVAETNTTEEPFSGEIPIGDLTITYSRSSGAGGQNVNKVNTKVEVRFNIDEVDWIPEWIKPKLKEQEQSKITKDGFLIVRSEKTRKQILNQADCLDKLRQMIFKASIKPKEPTKEELELIEKRQKIANRKRLEEKKRNSLRRQSRLNQHFY